MALAAIGHLQSKEVIDDSKIFRGLAETDLPGRMEIVWERPILVDGAHNPIALSTLMRSIGAHVPYDSDDLHLRLL